MGVLLSAISEPISFSFPALTIEDARLSRAFMHQTMLDPTKVQGTKVSTSTVVGYRDQE